MDVRCPGCHLVMPRREGLPPGGYYNMSPECWSVYTEVLAAEYSNAVLFGQVHQLTVDAYAAQHAGGPHPDKSVDVHLVGLYLVIEKGIKPTEVPPMLQRMAEYVKEWPHFEAPQTEWGITILDVALADDHIGKVREWSGAVWRAWEARHAEVAELALRAGA
ncbi:MAG TPA: DUF5946 family protein [Thermoanaerobaculia bacterium]|nr:DUF5946 family protein [Thermoanaerobaculia bacterium]